jgi:hypothetical protein
VNPLRTLPRQRDSNIAGPIFGACDNPIAIYLNDHIADATGGVRLAHPVACARPVELTRLAEDIAGEPRR